MALPLVTRREPLGVLFVNSRVPLFYGRERFHFLDSFVKLAASWLHNGKLFEDQQEYLRQLEELERYLGEHLLIDDQPAGHHR